MIVNGWANVACKLESDFLIYEHSPCQVKPPVAADLLGLSTPCLIPM